MRGGRNNTFALSSDGKVWGWGYNKTGKLANHPELDSNIITDNESSPVLSKSITEKVTKISVGGLNNANMALTENGEILSWGSDTEGTRGDGAYVGHWHEVVKTKIDHITNPE